MVFFFQNLLRMHMEFSESLVFHEFLACTFTHPVGKFQYSVDNLPPDGLADRNWHH
jgi:hypothetical protein